MITAKTNHLGISIQSNTVCVIGLDEHQKIIYSDTLASDVSFFQNDEVNVAALTETLTQVAQKSANLTNKAAVCFPERMAFSREHVLPKLKHPEIDEAIRWQIGTIFPLQADDIYIDWKLLGESDTETRLVVVAVNRKFLDGLQAACVAAGIQPMSFEPSASTLARAQHDQSGFHVILEVDSFGSSASLIENEVSSLTTTSFYTSDETLDQIINGISVSLQNLISRRKLQKAMPHPEVPPPVYLTGEKAAPKLAELLTTAANLPVSMLSLPTATPALHLPYLAALTALLPPESELSINLLPLNLQEQYQREAHIAAAKHAASIGSLLGSVSLLTAVGFCLVSLFINSNLTADIAKAQDVAAAPTSINLPLTLSKAQLINQVSPQKKTIPTQPILALSDAGIKNEQINKLTYESVRRQLQVTLVNISRDDLYTLKSNLEKTEVFTSISVPLSAFGTDSNPETTITMVIK